MRVSSKAYRERQQSQYWAALIEITLGINVNHISEYTSKSFPLPLARVKLTRNRKLVCM
jgi:hypothetical protein